MGDERSGLVVHTEDGAVGHTEATDWKIDGDNNLDIYNGTDQIATYRNGFWYYVGLARTQSPA